MPEESTEQSTETKLRFTVFVTISEDEDLTEGELLGFLEQSDIFEEYGISSLTVQREEPQA